jgi:hypothetical protein
MCSDDGCECAQVLSKAFVESLLVLGWMQTGFYSLYELVSLFGMGPKCKCECARISWS